ncbi:hypothetical protein FPQ18DRAFT_358681 [Pyronema domesticum]|nr:hypothetical protein FPQ18DRAFT_358681 [Pyronema domesticum]
MSQVDTSAVPSVRDRLAELGAKQRPQSISSAPRKLLSSRPPPPPPTPQRPGLPARRAPPPPPVPSAPTECEDPSPAARPPLPPRKLPPQLPTKPALPARTNTAPAKAIVPPPSYAEVKSPPGTSVQPLRKLPPREIPPPPPVRSKEPPTPQLPPRTPARAASFAAVRTDLTGSSTHSRSSSISVRSLPPPPKQYLPPPPPPVPVATRPPPIPISTRPSLSVPTTAHPAVSAYTCLRHRDFSAADAHAAYNHPKTNLQDLAYSLTSPFPSATDKARVIFTYLHYNVAYDWAGFKGHTKKGPQDAMSVLRSGLSVCQGYAELFLALAQHSGLEAALVTGHGKGYGYNVGEGISWPPSGHAWNAVRIDDGEWWLLDACWGAGSVSEGAGYTAKFNPEQFVGTPEEFGRSHFPEKEKWLLTSTTWEEYQRPQEKGPTMYGCMTDKGIINRVGYVQPMAFGEEGYYEVSLILGPCECLPFEKRPHEEWCIFVYVGQEFNKERMAALRRNGRRLSATIWVGRGEKVNISYVKTWQDRDGQGIDGATFERGVGKVGWSWGCLVMWDGV